ncbi:membrane protein insertase YidC [Paraglaciecola sp. MB-3u-78]|jgi:YidC/Oxa1 family membrane protein insertase|uniref:membrane protein insertase YidC n=1 Tax=Paraglaciecola sp. MB-3u-78 TaxID=2058332 RepID=UPI000C32CB07|nr:membrane protein insertase YidC [Paraglaciecola sp. MB-3u-78]PKG97900.1 membrane protein insertase YidC [Paraglaciecola sp. MB-3u-78]
MESQRSFLLIGLAMVGFLLWQQWQLDYGPQPIAPITTSAPTSTELDMPSSDDVPVASSDEQGLIARSTSGGKIISVITDTLIISIDTKGGDVVSANLAKFPLEEGSSESYSLLKPNGDKLFIAQSGLIGRDGTDSKARPTYTVAKDSYFLEGDSLTVPLELVTPGGLQVTKNFTFTRDSHKIDVSYIIKNNTSDPKQVQQFGQLKQSMLEQEGSMFMPIYRGGAYSTEEDRYEKYAFDDMVDIDLKKTTAAGWAAMIEHYFVSAWVPPQDQKNKLFSRILQQTNGVIGFTGESVTIQAGETAQINSILYLGPKDQDTLAGIARGLDLTVDYGFLFMISQPLFSFLQFIHSLVGNWGFSIILITIVVKGAMYPLTKKQYESMAKMRALKPKMDALKERFGDDKQKMQKAMMEMYKKDKVNPMGGCFPLLLQMPIFLALYWVLLESVELRHADFIFWITDLSAKDPFFVLPVLTGLSMWFLQKLQPMTMTDPMQQKIMQFMPVAMSLFFFIFPAGLVLYWLISNVITLIQAKIIYASMEKRGLKTK